MIAHYTSTNEELCAKGARVIRVIIKIDRIFAASVHVHMRKGETIEVRGIKSERI